MFITALFWLFTIVIAIQCGYALYFFTRITQLRTNSQIGVEDQTTRQQLSNNIQQHLKTSNNPATVLSPVSVIICAKNEAQNLKRRLPEILAQRYMNSEGMPMYEVVVVNDASDDESEEILQRLSKIYLHLKLVTISKDQVRISPGKKYALSIGVAHAAHPLLLLTDADCAPATEWWLSYMVAPLTRGKEIVAGYSGFEMSPGILGKFISWETMHTFLQYATYTLAGRPYMAVGRNLACTKAAFQKAQLHPAWQELPSGDDDLLVQAAATEENMAIVVHPHAFTYSPQKMTWSDWLRQKQRHSSTGKYYAPATKMLLGMYALSHGLSWLLFFVLVWFPEWGLVLLLFLLRSVLYWTIWNTTAIKLGMRHMLRWMPLCDWGWSAYNFVLSPHLIWKNKNQWK